MRPPSVGGTRRARRLLRPGGEADRAAHGGRDRARSPRRAGLPISGIGGIATWRDAAEFIALGATNVQVCTAAMLYGFRIVEDMIDGLSRLDGREGLRDDRPTSAAGACRTITDWQYLNLNSISKARHRPGQVHRVRPLPHRLRGHLAPGDRRGEGRRAPLRGEARRVRRLQPLRDRLPGARVHHAAHAGAGRGRRAHRPGRAGARRPTGPRTRTTRCARRHAA